MENGKGAKKREIITEPAIREFDNTRNYIANVSAGRGADVRFEVLWPIPQVADGIEVAEAETKARYELDLQTLITKGVQEISHGPNYGILFESWQKDGKPVAHEQLQALADAYKPGIRKPGAAAEIKAKAAKATAVEKAGISLDDLLKVDPAKLAALIAKATK